MNDSAATFRSVDERDVFLNPVVGFNLKAPPIGPKRAADIFFSQPVGNFVSLYAVMKCAHSISKLPGHIEDSEHLVRPVTVHVN